MAARLLALLLVLVFVVLATGVVVGLLAYGTTPSRTGRVAVLEIRAEATVRWSGDQPTITARSLPDTYTALGYLHALEAPWAMALWRQAATGRLAVWFGEAARPYDRHAHTLGLPTQARAAFDALPLEQQNLLDAYAAGVNRALGQPAIAQTDEFVLRDVAPDAWAPWHALAVERLLAYLGTEPPALLTSNAPAPPDSVQGEAATLQRLAASDEARAFAEQDRLFRAALFLGDFDASYAWTAPHVAYADEPAERTWMVHVGYGASALPLVMEVAVERDDRRAVLATVPGTLVTPSALTAGPDGQGGWLVLLTSRLAATTTTASLPSQYARLADRAGREQLVTTRRSATLLALTAPPERTTAPPPYLLPNPSDSLAGADSLSVLNPSARQAGSTGIAAPQPPAFALRWSGFGADTDTPAWVALVADALGYPVPEARPPFALFRGDGLRLDPAAGEATWTVLGTPPVRQNLPGGIFVGGETAHAYAAAHLADLLGTAPVLTPTTVATDRYSAWAASAVPAWLGVLGDKLPPSFEDATSYLRGWSYQYAPRAIAPTLLDRWVARYEVLADTPAPVRLDSTAIVFARLSLLRTVDSLTATFGANRAAWRWENTQPHARHFPIWSSPTDTLIHGPAERRYAPARLGLGGHPTALRGGTSPAFPAQGSVAQWVAWSRSGTPNTTTTLHATVTTRGPLARALDTVNLDRPLAHPPPPTNVPTLRLTPPR